LIQFVCEEREHGPLILFLKDVEKVCGNSYSYHGLKSKLESFPEGVFIIGSQIQADTRKDKVLTRNIIIYTPILNYEVYIHFHLANKQVVYIYTAEQWVSFP
jgi:hypothetical protein